MRMRLTRKEIKRRRKRFDKLLVLLELGRIQGKFGKYRQRQLRELIRLGASLDRFGGFVGDFR